MIEVQKAGSTVEIRIDTDLMHSKGGETIMVFTTECSNTQYADLLQRYLDARLHDRMETIRREAYNQGFYDGRRHQRKRTIFLQII